ncbi:MAG: PLP-dependent aminotransferase family protein, partial [Peptococcaceae bacterium]|nr:PLP-dependent aminotransferase family protein [Peptococcaceae bacterium]
GLYLTVQLKNGLSETEMCQKAEKNGVKVYPISPYFNGEVPEEHQSKVLLGFGALTEEQMKLGVTLLHKAWM